MVATHLKCDAREAAGRRRGSVITCPRLPNPFVMMGWKPATFLFRTLTDLMHTGQHFTKRQLAKRGTLEPYASLQALNRAMSLL